jgi:dTDP-4-amino-4,6-dideoxygalactose transaminase
MTRWAPRHPRKAETILRDTFLVFGSPLIGQAEIDEVVDSLRSGWIGSGPKVQRFEREIERYVGVQHARCVSSCTAALMLGLRALGIGPGDEVLVPAMTFVASANAVEHAGATPVLIDCEPGTGLIDLDAAEARISSKTKAIMPVHLYGRPVDMDRVNRIRNERGISVLEDAAHAIGAEWRGRRIGSHGNLAAYSFYVTKNITTIEGGALVTNDTAVAERVEHLALHGLSVGAWQRFSDTGFKHYEVEEPGFKFNMTDVQAALGLHQLPQLDEWINRRAELWEVYDQRLSDLPLELPPAVDPAVMRHSRHLYTVQVRDDAPMTRDELLSELQRQRIGVGVHYRGVHLHPYYRERYDLDPASLPESTAMSNRTLSLALSPKVTDADQADVIAAVWSALATPSPPTHLTERSEWDHAGQRTEG